MSFALAPVQAAKIATCPHGLPPGACPICSGAGGGGASAKKADFSAKTGEMSWSDCAAIGQLLKNQKMDKNLKEQSIQSQIVFALNFERSISNMAQRLSNFVLGIQNTIPAALARPIGFVVAKLLIPMLNILKDIPLNIQKTLAQIAEKIVDISDKLAAIYGELKNSIEKKISERLKDFKKKATSFFGLFGSQEPEDEEKQIEDAKRAFELKTVLEALHEKFTQKEDELNDEN